VSVFNRETVSKMLDFKTCPKCKNFTAIENEVCPNCGNNFKEKSSPHKPQLSPEVSAIEIKPVPEKKAKPNLFSIVGILFLLIVVFLIVVPTKTITTNVEVSYLDTETYSVQETYTAMDVTSVKETWQEVHTSSDRDATPEGYYWKKCDSPCHCSHYTSDPNTVPSYYCDECSCPTSGVYDQSRDVPKYQWVTKYRDVMKTRNVTKTRIEPGPVEVNWIIGFKTPWTFHLI